MLSGRRKLLLADDSPTIQKVISLTFEDEGLEVVAVSDGERALDALYADEPPDIVLADVHMPGPNGYELCERVRGDARLRHVPFVLLVGTFEPFNQAEARRVGADTVLTKPFQSIRDLVSKVGSLLGGGETKHDEEAARTETRGNEAEHAPATLQADAHAPREAAWAIAESRDAQPEDTRDDRATHFADFAEDDELIEARPADAFGGAADYAEPSSREQFVAETREHKAETQPPSSSFEARPSSSFASSPSESRESVMAAHASFASRAASAAAADDALLDLGQTEPPAAFAAAEADDFILDLEDEFPSHDTPAGHDAVAFQSHSYDEHRGAFAQFEGAQASIQSDAASAFAEAAHGEASAYDEHAASSADSLSSFAPFEFSAPQAVEHEAVGARVGFVEPEVVPADEPVPASVEGEFTDGSVEGDVAKPPVGVHGAHVSGYDTNPMFEAATHEPSHELAAPQAGAQENVHASEPSTAGYAVGDARAGLEEPPSADQLSAEAVEKIARRVVEMMSDKVVREIAWEVVPELAGLLIKQRLEEEGQK